MSDYKALAGVSRTLRTLLLDRIEAPLPVTIAPPDSTESTGKRVNLYLYQVSENPFLRNQEPPGQGHAGAYGLPSLSLDLHYLLTAYGPDSGDTADLQAQEVLGDAMQVLHDLNLITAGLRVTRPTAGMVGDPILDPGLADQFEKIKITLQPLTLDDFSKLWTALPETNFRRSVAYLVSVVQIDSRRPRRYPRPVGEPPAAGPRVYVKTFRTPQINELRVIRVNDPNRRERPAPYLRLADALIICGSNLTGESPRLIIGGVEATASPSVWQEDRIELQLPDDPILQPGPQTVRLNLEIPMGEPPTPRPGFFSNLGVLVLVPHIMELDLAATPGSLIIRGTRLSRPDRECFTLLGDRVIPGRDYTTATSTEISFTLPAGLAPGEYPVRVRVDGVESLDLETVTLS